MPARIDRLGLRWQLGDNVTLTLQAYVAITASSWQLGAALSIVAKLGPVYIDGALALRRHRLRRRDASSSISAGTCG